LPRLKRANSLWGCCATSFVKRSIVSFMFSPG
jgi:hypothetical protein